MTTKQSRTATIFMVKMNADAALVVHKVAFGRPRRKKGWRKLVKGRDEKESEFWDWERRRTKWVCGQEIGLSSAVPMK